MLLRASGEEQDGWSITKMDRLMPGALAKSGQVDGANKAASGF